MIQVYDKYGKIKSSGLPGTGTVTSFSAGNLSPLFNSVVTSPTSTPNISFSKISQAQKLFYASPNSGSGLPSFRTIQASDLPSLSGTYVPISRTLTINGVTFDLSADRTWTISSLPSQTGNNGKYLQTDGTNASWQTVDALPTQTGNNGKFLTTDGTIATWATIPLPTPAALTKTDDTNVTLTLGGSPSTALLAATSLTLGWTGTLADSRIASATTWNAKQDALSGTGVVKSTAGTISYINGLSSEFVKGDGSLDSNTYLTTAVTSVDLTMPSAFNVTGNPITTSGTIAVTGAGLVSQYIRGDGTLANFPISTGGGASVSYYLNGSVSQGTIGGVAYKEMNGVPVIGAGTDFTINADGYIAQFITDAGDPNKLLIPAGNWNFETYFSASSVGGSPKFYIELYKYDGTTFTLIATNSATPENITGGTSIDLYFTALAVPATTLLATDRLAVRFYVIHSGRTITMHTENSHLSQIITTFTTGLTALNGLTDQVQFFNVGTGATNFNISSSGNTHTFNLLFNIRRNANNSTNNNINYCGYAVTGSAESSAVWTITRLTIGASGSIAIATATNVAWTDREIAIYT